MTTNCWIMNGKCLSTPPEGYYGFIYKITDAVTGKSYFGKKAFEHSQKKTISKRARKASGTKKRIERVKKDSGWLEYWGSSKPLLEFFAAHPHAQQFAKREIIKLCKDKASLSYWEMVTLVENNVLFKDTWNGNILGKFFKGKIHE